MPASLEEYKPDHTQEQGDVSHSGHEEVYEGEGRGSIDPDATGAKFNANPCRGYMAQMRHIDSRPTANRGFTPASSLG